MSEENKIDSPPEEGHILPEENLPVAETFSDHDQPVTILEVNKHPHHVPHKKKWEEKER